MCSILLTVTSIATVGDTSGPTNCIQSRGNVVAIIAMCANKIESMKQSYHIDDSILLVENNMALFGMVWLLRVRSEMKRCAKCRREHDEFLHQQTLLQQQTMSSVNSIDEHMSASTYFTLDTPGPGPGNLSGAGPSYCEVHGYVPPKEGKKFIINSYIFKPTMIED